jgi:hydrogenase/urease accessory protein HupE
MVEARGQRRLPTRSRRLIRPLWKLLKPPMSSRKIFCLKARAILLAGVLAVTFAAHAHDPGLSTATFQLEPDKVEAVLVLSPADAGTILNLDKIRNGQNSKAGSAFATADPAAPPFSPQKEERAGVRRFSVSNSDPLTPAPPLGRREGVDSGAVLVSSDVSFPQPLEVKLDDQAVIPTDVRCSLDERNNLTVHLSFPARSFTRIFVQSKWLPLLPTGHRQYFSIQNSRGDILAEHLLSANSDSATLQLDAAAMKPETNAKTNSFLDFLAMGVKHIWTGYDHLLFLFGLMIVTRNFKASIKIITCFTIAHSITLAIATLNLVQISSGIVEPLIAASIVYVGLENLFRGGEPKGRWLLTFAFGLIHGFGFASVLRELGVGANGSSIAIPLISFNLGVELGQIAVAALALPLIWKLRTQPVFIRRWVPASSTIVALLGGYWFVQRVWF